MGESSSLVPAIDILHDTQLRIFSAADDPPAAEQCAVTIGRGFVCEPNNDFFCSDPALFEERWRVIAANSLLRSPHIPMLHSIGHEHVAVAFAYLYPDQKAPDDAPEPPGTVDLSATTRPETIPVRNEFLSYLSVKKAEFLEAHGSFEYIAFLSTRPEWRGRGLGSRLVRHVSNKADAAGRWCYLEATNPDNVRLYERHGFRQLETKIWTLESLPGKRIMLVPMSRQPAGATERH